MKYCEAKKDAKRVVCMAMDQKAQEAVGKVDSCDGCELFRIAFEEERYWGGLRRRKIVGATCLKDGSGTVKVWMIKRKSGRSIWKR